MNYPPPPYQPGSHIPPPPGGYPPGQHGGYQPEQGYPPPQGYPPQGYGPTDPYQQPVEPTRRRGGCKGCFFGCLIAFFVTIAVIGVIGVAGIFMVKSMFPTDLSFGDAAGCAVMRVIVNNADTIIDQTDGTASEKAEMRSGVRELQAEYDRQCGVQRLY